MKFEAVLKNRLNRRLLIQLSGIVALGCHKAPVSHKSARSNVPSSSQFNFQGLGPSLDAFHHVAVNHKVDILIRWGDPLFLDQKPFSDIELSADQQALRFGHGNDFVGLISVGNGRTLMSVNHESTIAELMFKGESFFSAKLADNIRIEMAAHGVSIFEIRMTEDSKWEVDLSSPYNRRITAHSQTQLSGPVAGHARVQTKQDPSGINVLGTLGNCSGGVTPWETILSCEENINHYFRGEVTNEKERPTQRRMKVPNPNGYEWFQIDDRFNSSENPTEANRFGWVVEIDPKDPKSIPKKRTAMGRFFHESANPVINSDGRVVVYMGDDSAFEHLYRFVSTNPYIPDNAENNLDLLDDGELSVAIFHEDGTLVWVPLIYGIGPLTPENNFDSQADVLIDTRRAGTLMGGTPMDRPEDVEVSINGTSVYVCLTKNLDRGTEGMIPADATNPRSVNSCGHIIEMIPPIEDGRAAHHSNQMRWDIVLLAGRPEDGAEYGAHHDGQTFLGCPDNACLDPKGRLWITTDGSEGSVGCADGLYAIETGEQRGAPTRLFSAPSGAEITGPCFDLKGETLFLCVQHPGLVKGFTSDFPSTLWPDFVPNSFPRPSVVMLSRLDGGVLGDGF